MSPASAGDVATAGDASGKTQAHPGGDDVLIFWHALPERHSALFDAMLQRYVSEKRANFRIEVKRFPTMDALREALLADGDRPHLALIDVSWQAELIARDRIVRAEDIMDRVSSMTRIIFKADTFPVMWAAVQQDGKAWTLPAFATVQALIYDVDMLGQAKLKAPPKTWAELVTFGKKLTDKTGSQWAFALPTDASPRDLGRLLQYFTEQAGGTVPTSMLSYKDPAYTTALQFWVDLVDKHRIAPRETVDRARVAMFLGSIEDMLALKATGRNVLAAPLPRGKAAATPVMLYSVAIMHKDPSQLDRQWQVGHWLVEFEEMLTWSLETPYIPANRQVTLSPGYFQYLQANPGLRAFLVQLPTSHVDPALPSYARVLEILGESAREALDKKQSPQEALNGADQKLRSVLQAPAMPVVKPSGVGG